MKITEYEPFNKFVKFFKRKMRYYKTILTSVKKYSFGEKNGDKKFLILKGYSRHWGLYSAILLMLPFMEKARKRGYIPVIDFTKTDLPCIQDEKKWRHENAWEYYYKQPSANLSLTEVYQSKNVRVLEKFYITPKDPAWNDMMPALPKDLERWSRAIRKNIHLNSSLLKKVKAEKKRIFRSANKVLGVGIRAGYRAGMMRNEALFNNHPKCATCEEYIAIVEKKMKEWNCDAIFLAVDDREYQEKFVKYFGSTCWYIDRKLMHFFKNDVAIESPEERQIEYEGVGTKRKTEEYIVETYVLAQCNSLYANIGGGTEFAYFLNGGKYENIEIYNEGVYTGLGSK